MAQLAFRWPGALVKEFESALDDYEQANYELDARFMIRYFGAVATGRSRFSYLTRNNAGVESSDWVPSINALVPIVYYPVQENWVIDRQ